ncbi:MAG TPA: DNA repair protein RadA [Gordonia sp. (in: high G+C Gram-positive bacteria)]|uniref:DNA repair protein RadA n=1 Tax=unclassified Gordonia (in: high G+C Gram-positive bacteria) TaxID=2657482 RepID=UPI0025B7FD5B|nr:MULTISPECIES: DNA repair protein RadA [unclassified Gordonia (in: high G+C Gram-positive bacteria)]HNP56994.1 DNA repair protein RadA [Gordonia sp. (in: high G+C Gram-positive bacteria)]HRC50957.1 DNA repair protein RadA [Gordonia sp. (in: high G+C Gram-positive bacteria)]
MAVKTRAVYRCGACGHQPAKWVGRCPECGEWGTVDEAAPASTSRSRGAVGVAPSSPAKRLTEIGSDAAKVIPTGIGEFDRVLGRGVVPGSVILLAGEPGVGKSTLLLEAAKHWARAGRRVLYVTGEESAGQVRLRAERTDAVDENVYLAAESDLATVLGHVTDVDPTLLIVDSVQTMIATDADGVHGGVTQIRAVTTALVSLAKNTGVAVVLVGHVTKDGAVAGPRSLEHLVDVVLSFEGDKHSPLRMVRGIKNRFGAADEVGCFEQRDNGIHQVTDPSGIFWHQRQGDVTGSAVLVTMDGKRALVGEVQALANSTDMHNPRRAVSGLDGARVAMILAVLQARLKMSALGKAEVYASTVGGMRVTEPAADLAIAMAVASVQEEKPIPFHTVVIGEVGLAGEVRPVSALGRRVAEAKRLGFRHAVIPAARADREDLPDGIRITRVTNLGEAVNACLFDGPPATF